MQANLFQGLENLNTGFDVETIFYFSETDFQTVLDRAEKLGIKIFGIEPWLEGEFYDVAVIEDGYKSWPQDAFDQFKKTGLKLKYAASYDIPEHILNEKSDADNMS